MSDFLYIYSSKHYLWEAIVQLRKKEKTDDNKTMEKYYKLLTEEELCLNKEAEKCTTIEELRVLEENTNLLNENSKQTVHEITNMTVEEFKKEYQLVDINDIKGKYGF